MHVDERTSSSCAHECLLAEASDMLPASPADDYDRVQRGRWRHALCLRMMAYDREAVNSLQRMRGRRPFGKSPLQQHYERPRSLSPRPFMRSPSPCRGTPALPACWPTLPATGFLRSSEASAPAAAPIMAPASAPPSVTMASHVEPIESSPGFGGMPSSAFALGTTKRSPTQAKPKARGQLVPSTPATETPEPLSLLTPALVTSAPLCQLARAPMLTIMASRRPSRERSFEKLDACKRQARITPLSPGVWCPPVQSRLTLLPPLAGPA